MNKHIIFSGHLDGKLPSLEEIGDSQENGLACPFPNLDTGGTRSNDSKQIFQVSPVYNPNHPNIIRFYKKWGYDVKY